MNIVNLLHSKTKKLIEKRLNPKNCIFEFEFHNVEARFKNMELGIKNALGSFFNRKTRIEKVKGFNEGVKRVFSSYEKDIYPTYFNKFIKYEELLEKYLPRHIAHYDHVIQVFLLGYNILTNWSYIIEKSKTTSRDDFFQLDSIMFSWLIAAYFHDYGYIIEKLHDFFKEFTEDLEEFSEFHIPIVDINPIKINYDDELAQKYFTFIYNLYNSLPKKSNLSESLLKDIFLIIGNNWESGSDKTIIHRKKCPLDHGIVSAITYLKILDKAETRFRERDNYPLKFKDWPANQNAILAIALHNFKEINFKLLQDLQIINSDCHLNLSSRNEKSLIAYLLIVCDSIQNWEREPLHNEYHKTELEHILIEENKMLLQVTHILGEEENKLEYLQKFLNEIKKLIKKLPIKVKFELSDTNDMIKSKVEDLKKLEFNENILNLPPNDKNLFLINIKHKILENFIYLTINL